MNFYDVKTLEELKTIGKHREIAKQLKELIGSEVILKTKNWQNLYESICNNMERIHAKVRNVNEEVQSIYFISKEAEIIFYLLELDGEVKLRKLGITKTCYTNKKRATKWRNDLAKIIHPNICAHPKADEAMSKLSSIHNEMVENGK